MKRLLLALIVAGALVGIPVYAHHSFAAQYFEEQTLSIEGELVEGVNELPGQGIPLLFLEGNTLSWQFIHTFDQLAFDGQRLLFEVLRRKRMVGVNGNADKGSCDNQCKQQAFHGESLAWENRGQTAEFPFFPIRQVIRGQTYKSPN